MKWFDGSIPVAIQQAKANKSLFVVYVFGEDDLSKEMEQTWNNSEVSSLCEQSRIVGLKLEVKSESCKQFSDIYPVVIIPSTFFIGVNGVPLEVSGGSFTPDDFIKKIQKAKELHQDQLDSAVGGAQAAASPAPSPSQPQTSAAPPGATGSSADASTAPELEDKVERAKALLEKKRLEKEQEEKEKLKEQERERRNLGKDMMKAKQWKEEYQAKEFKDQMKKDKEDERKAKEKVRAQIAKDKEDRALRFRKEKEDRDMAATQAKQAKIESQAQVQANKDAVRSETARIQFRLPNGSTATQQFPSSDPLQSARNFIAQHVSGTLGNNFVLKITFPKRTFTDQDMQTSLLDLGLAPSAVILVLPGQQKAPSVGGPSSGGGVLQMVLAPLLAIWNFLYTFIFGAPTRQAIPQRAPQDGGDHSKSTSSASGSAYKRRIPGKQDGNIHRLHSGNGEDDDDPNATWNGNSTQQM